MIKAEKRKDSFTEGSLWDKMIRFAIPLIITSVIQQLFVTADKIIAGQFISENAYGAIGVTGTISNFFIEFFMGFSAATTVVMAKYIGMQRKDKVICTAQTVVPFAVISGVFIAITGALLAGNLLKLLACPEDLFKQAKAYLVFYFLGMPFFMLYNFEAAMSRSKGDTKTPFYCLAIGGIVKLLLNLVFVKTTSLGVSGFGISTIAANAVSSFVLMHCLNKADKELKLKLTEINVDRGILLEIVKIGLPSGFLNSVFSISNLIMQRAINSLGTYAATASSAAADIEIYIQFIGNAFAQAAITFTGQNYGAGDLKRCNRVTWTAILLCNAATVPLSLVAFFMGKPLLGIFGVSHVVAEFALTRMKYTMCFKCVQSVMDIMAGCLQGYGYTFVPAVCTVIGVCGVRLLWIYTAFPVYNSLEALMFIYPVTQGIASLCHTGCYVYVRRKIKKG